MIKKAAALWGVSANEIESSFDPLVSLLITACASEISKIHAELSSSDTRVTERLIQLMTPDTLYGTLPAHGIVQVLPVEKQATIYPEHLFYVKHLLANRSGATVQEDIFFSPAQETKITNAKIIASVCGNQIATLHPKYKLQSTENINIKNHYSDSTALYLGLRVYEDALSLKDTTIFFQLQDVGEEDFFFSQLAQVKIFSNDKEISSYVGFSEKDADRIQIESAFSKISDKTTAITHQVTKCYEKQYLTINDSLLLDKKGNLPESLQPILELENNEEWADCHWLKLVFPRTISPDILKKLYCACNSFPVVNRKLEMVTYQLKDYIDVVPFDCSDLFLDIKQVSNTSGERYRPRASDAQTEMKGTYVLRSGEVNKLDSRKSKEYLTYMIELLKEESAAFSLYNTDFLQNNLSQLNQIISLIDKKISEAKVSTAHTNHLSLHPYKDRDTILLEYWTTTGETANYIKSGTPIYPYQGTFFDANACFIVQSTFGGKNNLTNNERLLAYRKALLTRNRIVTKADIQALCFEVCGRTISAVAVKKVFEISDSPKKGYVPKIRISLTPNSDVTLSNREWSALQQNILTALQQQSANFFEYKIVLSP